MRPEALAQAMVPLLALMTRSFGVGRLRFPPAGALVLATVGAILLLNVVVYRWPVAGDELSYWIGARRLIDGVPLYDPAASSVDPYAYRYPPVVAQVLVPIAALVPAAAFSLLYSATLLACLWWLGGRNLWVALALIAFPPVAVELWFRNVHLPLAVLLVAAIRGRPALLSLAAAIKIAPGLGILYLVARGAWRSAAAAILVGMAILAASVVITPAAWLQFVEVTAARGAFDESGFIAIPYALRVALACVLVVLAGRLRPALGEPILVVAVTVALPTLWFTALSMLVAIVPMVRHHRKEVT